MKKIIFLGLLFCFLNSFAQYDVVVSGDPAANTTGMWVVNKTQSKEVEGNYYLNDEFQTGVIIDKNGKKYKVIDLNYNLKTDQLESKISNDSVFAFNTVSILGMELGGQNFKTLFDPKKYRPTFYEIIGTFDNRTVLKHYNVKIRPGIVNPMTQQKQTPDRFIYQYTYYVTNKKGGLEELKLKKRHILNLFDDSAKSVKDYVSENDLSYGEDEDLRKIFNFYNDI